MTLDGPGVVTCPCAPVLSWESRRRVKLLGFGASRPWQPGNLCGQGPLIMSCLQDLSHPGPVGGGGGGLLPVRHQGATAGHRRHKNAGSRVPRGRPDGRPRDLGQPVGLVVETPIGQYDLLVEAPGPPARGQGPQPAARVGPGRGRRPTPVPGGAHAVVGLPAVLGCSEGPPPGCPELPPAFAQPSGKSPPGPCCPPLPRSLWPNPGAGPLTGTSRRSSGNWYGGSVACILLRPGYDAAAPATGAMTPRAAPSTWRWRSPVRAATPRAGSSSRAGVHDSCADVT